MNALFDFGVSLGYVWRHFGHQRVILERFGTTLGSTLAYEADFGSFWYQFGITLGRVGVALESRWHHFAHVGLTFGSFWDHFAHV